MFERLAGKGRKGEGQKATGKRQRAKGKPQNCKTAKFKI
jgi:hypothetical protein